jgi:hypothetical protein
MYSLLQYIISTYQVLKNEETTVKNLYKPLNSLPTVSSLRYHRNYPLHLKSVLQILFTILLNAKIVQMFPICDLQFTYQVVFAGIFFLYFVQSEG